MNALAPKLQSRTATLLTTALLTLSSQAATTLTGPSTYEYHDFHDPAFAGNAASSLWYDLSSSANPDYPGFSTSNDAWPSSIAAQEGDTGAALSKTSNGTGGGPYPASSSLYFAGMSGDPNVDGGSLSVTDSSPIAGLQTVMFQLQIGEAIGNDFYNETLPILSYTTAGGMTSDIVASFCSLYSQIDNGTIDMPTGEEQLYINTYGLQWDLSGVSDEITELSVSFTGVQHATLQGMRLDQTDAAYAANILPAAVPEPSTLLLGLFAMAGIITRRKR